jgi:hypothetical protein
MLTHPITYIAGLRASDGDRAVGGAIIAGMGLLAPVLPICVPVIAVTAGVTAIAACAGVYAQDRRSAQFTARLNRYCRPSW